MRDLDALLDTLVRLHGRDTVQERLDRVSTRYERRPGYRSPAKVVADAEALADPDALAQARARRARRSG